MMPVAVDEMIETRTKDGTGDAYVRVYLNQLKESFNCQLRAVTTGQFSDYLLDQEWPARSKNNAGATIGAFFKFCKKRGWLPRDHEGIELVPKFREKPTARTSCIIKARGTLDLVKVRLVGSQLGYILRVFWNLIEPALGLDIFATHRELGM